MTLTFVCKTVGPNICEMLTCLEDVAGLLFLPAPLEGHQRASIQPASYRRIAESLPFC
jgi:hypothetical protein